MSEASGFKLAATDATKGAARFPVSETKCAPFNDRELDQLSGRLVLRNGAKHINALRLLMVGLNSPIFRSKSHTTKLRVLYACLKACKYFNELPHAKLLKNDNLIFETEYKNWLINTGSTEGHIGASISALVNLIKQACQQPNTDHLKNESVQHICLNFKPYNFTKEPTPTLDTILPKCQHGSTDKDLLIGLRETMVWFLSKMAETRRAALNGMPESLVKYLSNLKINRPNPISRAGNFGVFSETHIGQPYDSLMCDLVDTLVGLKSNSIKELMFCSMNAGLVFKQHYIENRHFLRPTDLEKYFREMRWVPHSNCRASDNSKNESRPVLKMTYSGDIAQLRRTARTSALFPTLSFLIFPTLDESLAMEWLLASERIQYTGIHNLDVWKNVLWDPDNRSIQFKNIVKHRRRGEQHSPIYHNDILYEVYSTWVGLIRNSEAFVTKANVNIIPQFARSTTQRRRQTSFHLMRKGFWLMALDGTCTQNELFNELRDSPNLLQVKQFLHLLRDHLLDIKSATESQRMRYKLGPAERTKKRATRRALGICTKVIAQTRAVIDNDIMTGRLVGHSVDTHENVYVNRTPSRFVNAQSISFAADVGNCMRAEAEKLLQGSNLVSVQQIKKILGYPIGSPKASEQNELQNIIKHAETGGFLSELTGTLSKGNVTYVIVSRWSSALIQGYIDHIDTEQHRMEFKNQHRLHDLLLKKAYLSLLLERFPKKTNQQGKTILQKWNFPYPSLV